MAETEYEFNIRGKIKVYTDVNIINLIDTLVKNVIYENNLNIQNYSIMVQDCNTVIYKDNTPQF